VIYRPRGDHHHRGGGVRDPHREERSGDHEPEHQAFRARPHDPDDIEGDAPVQAPSLHRHSDDETPEEEKDHFVAVGLRHLHRGEDPEHREEDQRQQCGRLQGNNAGDPEQDHKDGDCRNGLGLGRKDAGVDGDCQDRKED